ncbi:MAG: glycosyl hydrolase [Bacteroidetes bacterium GWF2_33_16]|nr:MAG: glycosyl hydrolase [Bacteroidetes bacterium GWE2_32_14]OFY06637.1 MAG: glycosyl hydrolase [Bacteroidetes bacterium GWF2_33_16]
MEIKKIIRVERFSFLALFLLMAFLLSSGSLMAQKGDTKKDVKKEEPAIKSDILGGLKFRNIGPAFSSGRIADFAVNPKNPYEYYVAVASGHVWKTVNNGITFEPIFDNYGTYSIGCMAMDPDNSNVVWIGTGENNHQRALGYGNGIYKSVDGGKSWKNMGLKESRQIGMIAIDPRNSDVVYVAAEGSAWGSGGERGLYKTNDGGTNWTKVLNISEHTGINNVILDPRNPDVLYATSEQRRRHVHTKIGGGPESAIHKSTDAGKTWKKLESGLPKEDMGGIGIAISPVNPDVIYAIIEAANEAGGFFKSTDRGESWKKMSDYSSSGQYYNEIYCDPINVDKVFSVETVTQVTNDGGKTWNRVGLNKRHVDDHALWINPNNTDHFMIGGDGGVYITYDNGNHYMHVQNLPVIQFYRVAVDNDLPFYNVFGGTQDNNSFGGPSQNLSADGVTKGEWVVTIGGDGFWTRIDPLDPNIVYSEYQYGNIYRFDKKSNETVYIKPMPGKGELTYRWNWNTPFIISPHKNTRIYMSANVLFKSENRGDTWEVISGDLTANIDRNTWPVMGKYWSTDAVVKDVSTSLFGIIISLDESPVKEGLIYTGTDDGVLSVTEDGGKNWRKVTSFPGVPANTYISDVYASRFDENVVYVSFDNILRDDFKPYLLKSSDKGKTWKAITKGFDDNGTIHTIEQDFIDKDLLFAGTEFGVYFSYNGGEEWIQLKSGIPAIAVKDLAIQTRESDLVAATFGRGFYILDNYSPLREVKPAFADKEAYVFPIKDALMYIQSSNKYGQGSTEYLAENPPYGATFTYYLKDVPKTQKEIRQEKEKELFKEGKPIPQPSWKELEEEAKELSPYLIFTIFDEQGNVIRKITKSPSKGINRLTWDLNYANTFPLRFRDKKFDPLKEDKGSWMVMPGNYKVSLSLVAKGEIKELVAAQEFKTVSLNNTTLPAPDRKEMVDFQRKVAEITRVMSGTVNLNKELLERVSIIKQAILSTPEANNSLMSEAEKVEKELENIRFIFEGLQSKASDEEIPPQVVPLTQRLYYMIEAQINSTSAITSTSKKSLEIINEEFPPLLKKLEEIATKDIKNLETKLEQAKAPWTPGRIPVLK